VFTAEISEGTTLTIEAGAILKFPSGNYDFNVYGALIAQGTADEKIIFTSLRDDAYEGDTNGDGPTLPKVNDWSALEFADSSNSGDNSLTYCVFKYGGNGGQFVVDLSDNIAFLISHCVVSNSYSGIALRTGYSDTVSHCEILNNTDDGIYCVEASPSIDTCTF